MNLMRFVVLIASFVVHAQGGKPTTCAIIFGLGTLGGEVLLGVPLNLAAIHAAIAAVLALVYYVFMDSADGTPMWWVLIAAGIAAVWLV